MKKKLSRTLACVFLVIFISGLFPLPISAADGPGAAGVSDAALEIIKGYEGFSSKVRYDGTHYYIGYGNICSANSYPNGISREEAHNLLKKSVAKVEVSLIKFMNKYGISLSQNQFDAIASFTYNLGSGWLSYTNRLRTCLIEGPDSYTDVQFADAMGVWCHTGKAVNKQLLNRRIFEARLFLYGDYGTGDSPAFNYLILNPGEGEVDGDVVIYENNMPYGTLPTADLSGFYLLGWYTDDGQRLDPDTHVTGNYTVNAKWTDELPDTPLPEQVSLYSDTPSTAWYYSYITDLASDNIISGYSDGSFKPNRSTTYGEALKLILLAAGHGEKDPTGSHWASGFADFALAEGFIEGANTPDLDSPISRIDIAQVAAKALLLEFSDGDSPFNDTEDKHVLSLHAIEIIQGSQSEDGLIFNPNSDIRRSELSAIIWRIKHYLTQI